MTTGVRGRWVAAAVAMYAAWVGLQVWLGHHVFVVTQAAERAQATRAHELMAQRAHTLDLPPPPLHLYSWPSSFWLRIAAEGAVGMILVLAVGLALVAGGRRWWSLIVAGLPAAVVVGKFGDGQPIGAAWTMAWDNPQGWLTAGVIVDTTVVAVIVALLIRGLPRTPPAAAATGALLRAALPAVILVSWWLIQNPVDADGSRRVWIAQAVVWIAAVVLVATAALPAYAKLVTIVVVAPYLSATMIGDLVLTSTPHFDRVQFTHHLLFAVAVAGYAAGAPLLAKLGKRGRRNDLASETGALSRA